MTSEADRTEPSNPLAIPPHLEVSPEVKALSDVELLELAASYLEKIKDSDVEIHRYLRYRIKGQLGNVLSTSLEKLRGLVTMAMDNDFPAEK